MFPVFIARFYKGQCSEVLFQVNHYQYEVGSSLFVGNCEKVIQHLVKNGWELK